MSKVWTVWTANDDMETLLVGIATSEEKAYEMRGRLEEEFEDAFEYQVCCMETDKITINDTDIRFQSLNNDFKTEMEGKEMNEEKWKEEYKIRQKQNEIAEEIKNELLKKADTEHQRNVIKETINGIKRKHRFDYLKK